MNLRLHFGVALLLFLSNLAAAQQHRLTPEDVYKLQVVSDPQLSPDGTLVAYVVTTTNRTKNKRVASIWTVPADGSSEPKPFISDMPASSPRWSPDGRFVAFLSSSPPSQAPNPELPTATMKPSAPAADAKAQLWIVARDGSARRCLTHFGNGVSKLSWSPDGTRIAVAARPVAKQSDIRDYSTLFYKMDDSGWFDANRGHIWIVDVKDGATRQITNDPERSDNDPQWSPDGKWIAYTSEHSGPEQRTVLDATDLLIVSPEGGDSRAVLHNRANVLSPRWSPDANEIAYAVSPTPDDQPRLWIAKLASLEKPVLATDADLFPTEIEWDKSGLWFGAYERGTAPLFRVDLTTGHAKKIAGGERALHEPQISDTLHRLIYLENDDTHPAEVFSSDLDGRGERQLTFHNREWLTGVQLSPSERVSWKSADGLTIEGFLKRPVGFEAGQKYPMILNIHGGPNGMFGFHWEMDEQLYAANGYAVL
ncbi:MAG: S9 family peptidase, partial [Acidobacteriaceae bacterium]|nr:S9 family peptidase [Acidobacteriaceae bacterium]